MMMMTSLTPTGEVVKRGEEEGREGVGFGNHFSVEADYDMKVASDA